MDPSGRHDLGTLSNPLLHLQTKNKKERRQEVGTPHLAHHLPGCLPMTRAARERHHARRPTEPGHATENLILLVFFYERVL